MTESPDPGTRRRDELVRIIVSLATATIGGVGVLLHPRPHYLWLPSVVLCVLSLTVAIWAIARVVRGAR
jgi:hypothetical protein